MASLTGVFAKIKMTSEAKSKFYKEKGEVVATDYFCIQKAYKNSKLYDKEMELIVGRQRSGNPMTINEYMEAIQVLNEKYNSDNFSCDPEDLLIIRYDLETESLFYFQMFRWGATNNLDTSVSLQSFLKHIATYKDLDSEDFIFFSDTATSLLESQFYKIWSVKPGLIKESELKEWNKEWEAPLEEVDKLSKKYYFDIVDKYTKLDESGEWITDNDGLDKELESSIIDNELLVK